jgi:hypothetical protein
MSGRAQDVKTVAAGVYTDAQAARGALTYENECSRCHRIDLGGGNDAPSLKEQRFTQDFAGKDLKALFTKISTTMPQGSPGSLADSVYLDVLAHVLKENGFPAGERDLAADGLEAIQVVAGRPKPPPPLSNFSYVDVIGCLTAAPNDAWMLTRGSDPVPTLPPAPGRTEPPRPVALGSQTFRLLDAMSYHPELHKGQKVAVRGLLIRSPDEQRLTISSFDVAGPTCSP